MSKEQTTDTGRTRHLQFVIRQDSTEIFSTFCFDLDEKKMNCKYIDNGDASITFLTSLKHARH
jgi:hypothetical protein